MFSLSSKIIVLIFIALSGCTSINSSGKWNSGYNLNEPDDFQILPDILNEVSGLTWLGSDSFACIQDENGILFIYDARKKEITRQVNFGVDGDYESIARVDRTIYVLRSDGVLFGISNFNSDKFSLEIFFTNIPSYNNEGICYDRGKNRLLIACKGKSGNSPGSKDKREIYGFDLIKKALIREPVFKFDLKDIKQFAIDNQIDLPAEKSKKRKTGEPLIRFEISDLCIHPLTGKLYILSSSDHLLFVFNMNGEIENIERLNPGLFSNAEGIAFFENGDMLITNEGQNKSATLLRFNYKKK
jgi:uncharacterized protein YjiK